MSKKFAIIAGIISIAALCAGIVAVLLLRNKDIAECLEEELNDFDAIDDEDIYTF